MEKKFRKKRMLKWWVDKGQERYYLDENGYSEFSHYYKFGCMETHPLENYFKGDWDEATPLYKSKEFQHIIVRSYFPLLIKDGGGVGPGRQFKDLETLKIYINFPIMRKIFINNARCLYNYDPYRGHFDEFQINWLRKAMQTYAKVADDSIYQEVLDKYGWNEAEEKDEK